MNPFELITDDEVLYQICQGWDDQTLTNMAQAYGRVQRVCANEINLRTEIQSVKTELEKVKIVFYFRNFTNETPDDIQSQVSLLKRVDIGYVEGQTVKYPYLDIQQLIKFLKHGKDKNLVKNVVSSIVPTLPLKIVGETGLNPDIFGSYDFSFIREYKSDFGDLERIIKMLHQQGYILKGSYNL